MPVTGAFALLLLVLAAAPVRAQSDDPEPPPTDRRAQVEHDAWAGTLTDVAALSAMIDRLDVGDALRLHQNSLMTVAVSAGSLLGLADLLVETAYEPSQDAIDAGPPAPKLDGPARAARLRDFSDLIRQQPAALGIPAP